MNTILTDDELKAVRQEEIERFSWKFNELRYARAIEAAVLAKLAQQEPVAEVKDNPHCPEGHSDELTTYLPVGMKLYAAPPPAGCLATPPSA